MSYYYYFAIVPTKACFEFQNKIEIVLYVNIYKLYKIYTFYLRGFFFGVLQVQYLALPLRNYVTDVARNRKENHETYPYIQ